MRINRLFQIVAILLNRDVVTAKELSKKLEVSTRTIYRDIDILSSSGIPVFTNKGAKGGISLLENYTLDKAAFSKREREELLLNLNSLKATRFIEIDEIMDKLSGLFQNVDANDWIEVDFSQWGSDANDRIKFAKLKESIMKSRVISFRYHNSYGQTSKRRIRPLKLVFKSKAWYVLGFCEMKNDFRIFKTIRMREIQHTEEVFDRDELCQRDGFKLDMDSSQKSDMVDLKLEFSKSVSYMLYDYFPDGCIGKNEDGSFTVEVSYPMSPWIYSFLLSFGEKVEVLEPLFIREGLVERIRSLSMNYGIK